MSKAKHAKPFPIRAKQHVSETDSAALLRRHLPRHWVIRELTERDYGIDALIEIVGEDERMTGNVIVAQVKSLASFRVAGETRSYKDLQQSTFNYLLGNPAPAYLFLCSLKDESIYWRSIREVNRERKRPITANAVIEIRKDFDLSASGQNALRRSVAYERVWPDVERAAISALMFFNALGPIYLACRRQPEERPLPSSVQLLMIQHFEYNQLLHRHFLRSGKRFGDLPEFYDEALSGGNLSEKETFTAGFATEFISSFVSEYYDAIEVCDRVIRAEQRDYWFDRYPYVLGQIDCFPPYFVEEDWYARYHFDEYESETKHISLDLFFDVDSGTRNSFSYFMNTPPTPVTRRASRKR